MEQSGVEAPIEDREKWANIDITTEYFDDIGQIDLLTKEDEVELGHAVREGMAAVIELRQEGLTKPQKAALESIVEIGLEAKDVFISANLRLVVSIAKAYREQGLPLLDLVQEGNLGLIHAVKKFNPDKGFKFSTYGSWWIRQAIQRGIYDTSTNIRVPIHSWDRIAEVERVRDYLQKEGESHDDSAVARFIDISDEEFDKRMKDKRVAESVSLYKEFESKDGEMVLEGIVADPKSAVDFIATEEGLNFAQNLEELSILAYLSDTKKQVLALRFSQGLTFEEVGKYLGLHRNTVEQHYRTAMDKIRRVVCDMGWTREDLAS